ncbi:hypothetical protein [Roseibium marinum]|uniref:Uncharacterized protein n=1 Tax=Roseibium marinum TaxID=281252 RepID=A0A2S3UK29_9HYPH|nr:hypothetical protein [Roseibium marinum]POF27933.1 hypothetical protein CLV41_11914 [Roseibium marinum]
MLDLEHVDEIDRVLRAVARATSARGASTFALCQDQMPLPAGASP